MPIFARSASSRLAVAAAMQWLHRSRASKLSAILPPRKSLVSEAAMAMFFTAFRPSSTMARLIEPICPGSP